MDPITVIFCYFGLQHRHALGNITTQHIPGIFSCADGFTKALGWTLHTCHAQFLMGHHGSLSSTNGCLDSSSSASLTLTGEYINQHVHTMRIGADWLLFSLFFLTTPTLSSPCLCLE